MSWEFWALQFLNGLQYSMLLFLLSIGLTVIFGLLHFINLAHGALYMLGAYLGVSLATTFGFWGALALAPVGVTAVGAALYFTLIRRLRQAGPMNSSGHLRFDFRLPGPGAPGLGRYRAGP